MIVRASSGSGGSGSGGFYLGGVTPAAGTYYSYPTAGSGYIELGFAPKQVVVVAKYTSPSIFAMRLDVDTGIITLSIGTTKWEENNTSTYSADLKVVGTKLYYKAHNVNYAVESYIIAS